MYINCNSFGNAYCEFCARVDIVSGEFGHEYVEFVSSASTLRACERVSKVSDSHRSYVVKNHGCPTAHS